MTLQNIHGAAWLSIVAAAISLGPALDARQAGAPSVQYRSPEGTAFPAITVPMGFTNGSLPAGLQFLGSAWAEPMLMRLAFAYEHATLHRRPPTTTLN